MIWLALALMVAIFALIVVLYFLEHDAVGIVGLMFLLAIGIGYVVDLIAASIISQNLQMIDRLAFGVFGAVAALVVMIGGYFSRHMWWGAWRKKRDDRDT